MNNSRPRKYWAGCKLNMEKIKATTQGLAEEADFYSFRHDRPIRKNSYKVNPEIKISKQRFIKETDKSLIFATRSYGARGIIVIPKSQIISRDDNSEICRLSTSRDSITLEVTHFIMSKIREELNKMSFVDVEIVSNGKQ